MEEQSPIFKQNLLELILNQIVISQGNQHGNVIIVDQIQGTSLDPNVLLGRISVRSVDSKAILSNTVEKYHQC